MKTSVKRIVCSLFAFCILVLALSACGGSKDDSNANNTSNTSSKTTVSGDASNVEVQRPSGWVATENPYEKMPESIKGQTVRYATWIDHYNTEGAVPLANIENDIGIKAELFTVPQGGYFDQLMAMIATGDVPDVVKSNEGTGCFPLTLQVLQPINKCSTVDLTDSIWDQTILETATIDGNIYLVNTIGSPWSGSNLVYYNKALFEENGFKTPAEYYEEGNWTWATMEKVLKDVKSLGEGYQGGYVDVEVLGDSAGASFCKYDYKTATFSSGVSDPKLLATYETYAKWKEAGLVNGNFTQFKEGKCGIVITGVYGLKKTGHWMTMDPNDVGYTYLPALQDGTIGLTSSIYRMYGVCTKAPHADAAGWFIRYWLDPENYELTDTFITNNAGNFYYELTNNPASNKYFNFDDGCAVLIGSTSSAVFNSGAKSAASAQVNTKIQAVSNQVDQAVAAANDLIQKVKDQYK